MGSGESDRYSRQIRFEPIGENGQKAIREASVCIIGCGALGSFQAESLGRAGIGRLGLVDRDYVDFSNLQRQWLYEEADARDEIPKAVAAARRIAVVNREVQVTPVVSDVTPSNVEELTADFDLLLDGTDNFETRYLLNDLSVKRGVPWIYGAAIGAYGVVMPIDRSGRWSVLSMHLSRSSHRCSADVRCKRHYFPDDGNGCCLAGLFGPAIDCWMEGLCLPDSEL